MSSSPMGRFHHRVPTSTAPRGRFCDAAVVFDDGTRVTDNLKTLASVMAACTADVRTRLQALKADTSTAPTRSRAGRGAGVSRRLPRYGAEYTLLSHLAALHGFEHVAARMHQLLESVPPATQLAFMKRLQAFEAMVHTFRTEIQPRAVPFSLS